MSFWGELQIRCFVEEEPENQEMGKIKEEVTLHVKLAGEVDVDL